MANYQCAVSQDSDGRWKYFDVDDTYQMALEVYPTREQAEREAARYADEMQKQDLIEANSKEVLLNLIPQLADQAVRKYGLDRNEILLNIRYGFEAAMDEAGCPEG